MRGLLLGTLALAWLGGTATPGLAQDVTAEVQTWDGRVWRVTEPSLETFYTVMPKPAERPGMLPAAPAAPPPQTGSPAAALPAPGAGPAASQGSATEPEPTVAQRQRTVVSLFQGGIEVQIPLSQITSLVFVRQRVPDAVLPPYVAPTHFRHSVIAVLRDGASIDAAYVNLGTTVLRGTADGRRVDIPWEEIAVLRFSR